jgi:aspartate kinase
MKFGGTSVGDADCIRRSAQIIAQEARQRSIVVVVSALAGVTNQLLEAVRLSARGEGKASVELGKFLRHRHLQCVDALVKSHDRRRAMLFEMEFLIEEAVSLCRRVFDQGHVDAMGEDAVAGIGERLSARLMAQTLCEMGERAVAVDASDFIVTDENYGRAEPLMTLSRERTLARLLPLVGHGTIPVVTGFIGATAEGIITTLGRGGSDYSATILAALMDAEDVIIWTDVDGVLTADPRIVPEAHTLPEISYSEAAELAYFGAKVLHPKILQPITSMGIPLWIRNSFAPERAGTKISPAGKFSTRSVKAISAITDVNLITVGGRGIAGVPEMITTTFAAAAKAHANILMISQSSSQRDICFVVNSRDASLTHENLRHYFAFDSSHQLVDYIDVAADVAIVAAVGEGMWGTPGIAGRMFDTLGKAKINILAIAQGSSEFNISAVIEAQAVVKAVQALHRAFDLHHPLHIEPAARVRPALFGAPDRDC